MGTKRYASGSDISLLGAYESTAGVLPSSGWRYLDVKSFNLSPEQPLERDQLLGKGRDPGDPAYGRLTVTGDAEVPLDARNTGFWLKALLGAPVTTQVKATGYIQFSGQPANNSTMTFNGGVMTAKTSGASGDQFNIGATLDDSITAAVTALNASANAEIAKCTYTANLDLNRIEIEIDVAGTSGNTFTLAASTNSGGLVSAATLLGGGYQHVWLSGSGSLPTEALQVGYPELLTPIFSRYLMVALDQFSFDSAIDGLANAQINLMARERVAAASTVEASPTTVDLVRFNQSRGYIKVGGTMIGGVTGGKFSFSNNLDPVVSKSENNLVDEFTPTNVAVNGELTARFDGASVIDIAESNEPTAIEYGFTTPTGWLMKFEVPRAFLSRPRENIAGPGGIDMTYQWEGAKDATVTAAMRATMINDISEYV